MNAVGTPVSRPGTTTLGDVWGNVTITSSGVTLKDTVVAGNLYVTAGVELGDVVLENVKVLGEIVVSGGGVSEAGEDSVILRNVDAPKLVVDNIKNQQVSLRVEGDGLIQQASVRTDAFLADNTPAGHGIGEIELNGENGLELKLAGNIKNVVNRTPESALSISSGRVDTITVDEKAVDSTLEISSRRGGRSCQSGCGDHSHWGRRHRRSGGERTGEQCVHAARSDRDPAGGYGQHRRRKHGQ